jgi:hypothetical protein
MLAVSRDAFERTEKRRNTGALQNVAAISTPNTRLRLGVRALLRRFRSIAMLIQK